jgi:hypothetical protein
LVIVEGGCVGFRWGWFRRCVSLLSPVAPVAALTRLPLARVGQVGRRDDAVLVDGLGDGAADLWPHALDGLDRHAVVFFGRGSTCVSSGAVGRVTRGSRARAAAIDGGGGRVDGGGGAF